MISTVSAPTGNSRTPFKMLHGVVALRATMGEIQKTVSRPNELPKPDLPNQRGSAG